MSIETSQELDQQKAAGTNKRKTKRSGINPAKVSIQIWWTYRIHDVVKPMIQAWDPNGPEKGGPFRFVHPESEGRRVSDLIIEKMSATEKLHGGTVRKLKMEGEEWVPEPKKAGGTTTPKSSLEWTQNSVQSKDFSSPNMSGASGRATPDVEGVARKSKKGGLDGPNGPSAGPGSN